MIAIMTYVHCRISQRELTTRKIIQNAVVVEAHEKSMEIKSKGTFPSNSQGKSSAITPIVCVPTTPIPAHIPPNTIC